jgi:IMP dehydrogenase
MIREGLTFDDVLLVPQNSTVRSRSEVDISVQWGGLHFEHPIIPANMKTVTGKEMALEIIKSGGLAVLHRFMEPHEQFRIVREIFDDHGNEHFAVSVGVKQHDKEMIERFWREGVRIVCIDVAHGDSEQCIEMTKWIKNSYQDMFIIAGNVATGGGAERLWRAGADAVKTGIGAGSTCSTRVETGAGVPQLTALMDVASRKYHLKHDSEVWGLAVTSGRDETTPVDSPMYIIADGGIKNAGDIVKSLCFADMIMTGNLFSGCEEAFGKRMIIDGVSYKEYVGSSTYKTNHIEGVAALVPTTGSYKSVLTKLLEGLRSGMSYQNAHNLKELQDNPEFVRITNAGLRESHPHDVILK